VILLRPDLSSIDKAILGEGWLSDEPYRNVEAMSDLGSRFGGTESEKKAIDFLSAKMRDYGFENVHTEAVQYAGWTRGSVSLEITSPQRATLESISLPYTGTSDVEAEVVNLGYGTPGEWESNRDSIKGRIVLVDAKSPVYFRRGIHRLEKYGRAVYHGAVGFIWMRDQGGFLAETGGLRPGAEIPGVGVSKETGEQIKRHLRHGPVRVRIRTKNDEYEATTANVVGDIPGKALKDHVIVIGAHFDGHDIATGSLDDASGAAVVLEAGRLLAQHRGALARTVRLVCFPVEEIGLYGSKAYVKEHAGHLGQFDFMLNLDGAGREGDKGIALQDFTELIPFFKDVARDMKWPMIIDNAFGMHSDMYPFSLAGVPSGNLSVMEAVRTGRDWGHTAADTIDKVSSRHLRGDSILVARTMLRAAVWEDMPSRHKTDDEVQEVLRQNGLSQVISLNRPVPR